MVISWKTRTSVFDTVLNISSLQINNMCRLLTVKTVQPIYVLQNITQLLVKFPHTDTKGENYAKKKKLQKKTHCEPNVVDSAV